MKGFLDGPKRIFNEGDLLILESELQCGGRIRLNAGLASDELKHRVLSFGAKAFRDGDYIRILKIENEHVVVANAHGEDRVTFVEGVASSDRFIKGEPLGTLKGENLKLLGGAIGRKREDIVTFVGGKMFAGTSYGLALLDSGLHKELAFNLERPQVVYLPPRDMECFDTSYGFLWIDLGGGNSVVVKKSNSASRLKVLPLFDMGEVDTISLNRSELCKVLKEFDGRFEVLVDNDELVLTSGVRTRRLRLLEGAVQREGSLFLTASVVLLGLKGCTSKVINLEFGVNNEKHRIVDGDYKYVFMGVASK